MCKILYHFHFSTYMLECLPLARDRAATGSRGRRIFTRLEALRGSGPMGHLPQNFILISAIS